MQVKHIWKQNKKSKLLGGTYFEYTLTMRGSITKEEQALINKYDAASEVLYSNLLERAQRQDRVSNAGSLMDMWSMARETATDRPEAEYTLIELLKGITITHKDPYYLDEMFGEISSSCKNLMSHLTGLEQRFSGEESVTEIEYA